MCRLHFFFFIGFFIVLVISITVLVPIVSVVIPFVPVVSVLYGLRFWRSCFCNRHGFFFRLFVFFAYFFEDSRFLFFLAGLFFYFCFLWLLFCTFHDGFFSAVGGSGLYDAFAFGLVIGGIGFRFAGHDCLFIEYFIDEFLFIQFLGAGDL